jgi:hypothetical protein
VSWGEETTDEMCIGFMQLTVDAEHLENRSPDRVRPAPRNLRGGDPAAPAGARATSGSR